MISGNEALREMMKGSLRPRGRRTVKFCRQCGGTHAGTCQLVTTSHGTMVRPDQLEAVERRFREQLEEAA